MKLFKIYITLTLILITLIIANVYLEKNDILNKSAIISIDKESGLNKFKYSGGSYWYVDMQDWCSAQANEKKVGGVLGVNISEVTTTAKIEEDKVVCYYKKLF